jgi:hypothetical protein
LVKKSTNFLIIGAAKRTIGTIVAQDISQELNQLATEKSSTASRVLVIAEATAAVMPD